MKKVIFILVLSGFITTSCNDDKNDSPSPVENKQVAFNRELGRAFIEEGLGAKSAEQLASTFSRVVDANYIQHNPLIPNGREATQSFIGSLGTSFSNIKVTVRDILADETRVLVRWTLEGEFTGEPFLGLPANNKKFEFDGLDLWTVRDGKLYEHWDQLDYVRFLIQLGSGECLPDPIKFAFSQPIER